jgi:hypothetical protein
MARDQLAGARAAVCALLLLWSTTVVAEDGLKDLKQTQKASQVSMLHSAGGQDSGCALLTIVRVPLLPPSSYSGHVHPHLR